MPLTPATLLLSDAVRPLAAIVDLQKVAPNATYFVRFNLYWMMANTMLGFIPWLIAYRLFRLPAMPSRRPLAVAATAVGALVFLLTISYPLYVLSDVIHLPGFITNAPSPRVGTLIAIPAYTLTFTIGFVIYVDCVRRARAWVLDLTRGRLPVVAIDLPMHIIAIAGIIVGRVTRFQVWDMALAPGDVAQSSLAVLTDPASLVGIAAAATALTLVTRVDIPMIPPRLHRYLPPRTTLRPSA